MVLAWFRRRPKADKCLYICICICFGISVGLGIRQLLSKGNITVLKKQADESEAYVVHHQTYDILKHPRNIFPALNVRHNQLKNEIHHLNETSDKAIMSNTTSKSKTTDILQVLPNYNVHVFYYQWYGTPEKDGKYYHWDHNYIPHWKKEEIGKWRTGRHKPPDDIGANFYPSLGPYSSSDPALIDKHMEMILAARIGVVVVSWYPPGTADGEGNDPDSLVPLILESADKYNLKVALHIEPYKNRDEVNMKANLKYIVTKYGNHPAFYRYEGSDGKKLPVYYIYDSYLLPGNRWKLLLKPEGTDSVRNTPWDGIFIGLLVEQKHQYELLDAGFDGLYTYFASNGFTYGSKWTNWRKISMFAKSNKLLFIPSVGPGYIDTEVRPWNAENTKSRENGNYYNNSFSTALAASPSVISITSFNEWHEGTQVEPAIPKSAVGRIYENYGTHDPNFYLKLTKQWVDKFTAFETTK